VPETHLEVVKESLFELGAGKYNNYDKCAWQSKGIGQFRPLEGSDPFIGNESKLEKVDEYKVELICKKEQIKAVLEKLVEAHPYEEPAYHVLEVKTLKDF
jgi:hypothetical protein